MAKNNESGFPVSMTFSVIASMAVFGFVHIEYDFFILSALATFLTMILVGFPLAMLEATLRSKGSDIKNDVNKNSINSQNTINDKIINSRFTPSPRVQKAMATATTLQLIRAAVSKEVAIHLHTLWARKAKLTIKNAYGDTNEDKWKQEAFEFVTRAAQRNSAHACSMAGLRPSMDDSDWLRVLYTLDAVKLVENNMGDRPSFGSSDKPVNDLSGIEYEMLVKEIVEQSGWETRTTATSGDQGIDLIAARNGISIGIQCKRSSSSIGNKAVQEVIAGMRFYGLARGAVVSNSDYTPSAKALAASSDIALLHHGELEKFLGSIPEIT